MQPDHSIAVYLPAANEDIFDEQTAEPILCQLSPSGACEPRILPPGERRAQQVAAELVESGRRKAMYGKKRPKRR